MEQSWHPPGPSPDAVAAEFQYLNMYDPHDPQTPPTPGTMHGYPAGAHADANGWFGPMSPTASHQRRSPQAGPPSPGPHRHPVQQGSPLSLGWGGQAIPDAAGFRVPWFGRSRGGKGGMMGRGRGRGRQGMDRGRRGMRRGWNGPDDRLGSDEALSVEELVQLIQRTPNNQRIPEQVLQALYQFDSRAAALLLKDLSKTGLGHRAKELFEWLRKLDDPHPLHCLCDVYTYTAMISMCIYQQDADSALELANEMRVRNIERNVHTYTALMNVCIKCGRCPVALDTYHHMRSDGCMPNVVTYNTLIDVYGKMGQWELAVKVLTMMKSEGVEPVLRTYNTLIIACNMCNQPREAMAVYKRMLDEGYTPNATTYNALISAHGKAGQLDKVMEVFQEMVWKGCERSVITYSSLISACEKAGQWELALELFNEMHSEGCSPNTVTFNSLITACAQGMQWRKAAEVFEEMHGQGCTPDVVTYTALISAYEKGGQWRRALGAFEQMRAQGCKADAIVYNAIIDSSWETGVVWAQRRALVLFRQALDENNFKQQRWDLTAQAPRRVEVNLHAMTAGVAMLSLYVWLMGLKQCLLARGAGSLPARLAIVSDKGKSSKEAGNLVVKEAVAAMMSHWEAPFRPSSENSFSGVLEADGEAVEEWLVSNKFEAQLFMIFPCTDLTPSLANKGLAPDSPALQRAAAALEDYDFSKEGTLEERCTEAFAAVQHFEKTHCLALQNMSFAYLQRRPELVHTAMVFSQQLHMKDEVAHDAILLMDRTMSTSLQIKDELLELLAAACILIASRQGEVSVHIPTEADFQKVTGYTMAMIEQMDWSTRRVLVNDTSAISTLRCLKLYLERLGCNFLDPDSVQMLAGTALSLVHESISDMAFLNCRPSVIAAATIYAERRARGIIPFWPSMLAKLTGYHDMSTPELSVAIKAAQRLTTRLPPPSPSTSSSPLTPRPPATP